MNYNFNFNKFKLISKKFKLLFSIIIIIQTFTLMGEPVTKVENFETITKLNSSTTGQWYATAENLNPIEYYNTWEKNEDKIQWREYQVPGDINKIFPAPWKIGFKVFLKKEIEFPVNLPNSNISIRLGAISDRDRTYFNGILIGSTGKFDSDRPEAYDRVRIYSIPEKLIKPNQKNLLLIEVQSYFDSYMGIHQDELEIGLSHLMSAKFNKQEVIKIFIISIYITIGFIFLFLFIHRRNEIHYLYFSLFLLFFSLYQFLRTQEINELGFEYYLQKEIGFSLIPLLFPLLSHFFISYFKISYKLYHKILDSVIITIAILLLFTLDFRFKDLVTSYCVIILYLIYAILFIYWVSKKALEKNNDAIFMLVGIIALSTSLILDILSSYSLIVFPKVSGLFFLLFILGLAIILGRNIEKMRGIIEDLNQNLEKKVKERTEELNQSLSKIQKFKNEQDELYFIIGIDLKESIAEITGLSTLLFQLEFIDSDERVNVLNELYKRSEKLSISLENLIEWTKLQSDLFYLSNQKVNLHQLVTNSIGILKESAARQEIKLQFQILNQTIEIDPRIFGFIIRNIFSNAIKFTKPGGAVKLNAQNYNNDLILTIEDTGIGFDKPALDRFISNREIQTTQDVYGIKGTGLGLKISAEYIQKLNATFNIQSEVGKGTKVTIQFNNCIHE